MKEEFQKKIYEDVEDRLPITQTYYLEDGKSVDEKGWSQLEAFYKNQGSKPPFIVGKHIAGEIDTYYLLFAVSQLFDPYNTDIRYRVRPNWKFRKVSKFTFNTYLRFIQTKQRRLLYQAERGV